jgi:hypothetical protein
MKTIQILFFFCIVKYCGKLLDWKAVCFYVKKGEMVKLKRGISSGKPEEVKVLSS